MQRDSYLVPSLFSVTKISETVALGIGVTSNWGLTTDWAQNSFCRYSNTRFSMKNTDYLVNMAYKLNERFSFGGGIVIDNSTVSKEKKFAQAGSDGNFKLVGDNVAAGYKVSMMYKLTDRQQVGLQYSSDIRRKYHGKVHLDDINVAYWNAALGGPAFSGSSYETEVVEKYTLPQSIDLGYSIKATDKLLLSVDISWMDWSQVKKEELAYPNESNPYTLAFLNNGNPANRDWRSSIAFGLGSEYDMSDRLRLRGGYFYHQTPIVQDTFDPSLPDSDSHTLTTGFGYDINKSLTLDMSYGALYYEARAIKNGVSSGQINGKYTQWMNLAEVTVTYKF